MDQSPLDTQVCFQLYAASRAMTATYRPRLDALGLTYPQYLVMLVLWQQDELSVGELCTALTLDSGTLSPLLKRLEAAGLLKRTRSAADERRVEIRLTETGRELQGRACGIPAEMYEATGLSLEELTALHGLLQRLTKALSAHATKEI